MNERTNPLPQSSFLSPIQIKSNQTKTFIIALRENYNKVHKPIIINESKSKHKIRTIILSSQARFTKKDTIMG